MYRCVGRYSAVALVLSAALLFAGCTQGAEEPSLARADGGLVAVISISSPESTTPPESEPATESLPLPERQKIPEAEAPVPEASAPVERAEEPNAQIEEIPEPPIPQAPAPPAPVPPETAPPQTDPPVVAEPEPPAFPSDGPQEFIVHTGTEQLEVTATALYSQAQLVFEVTNRQRQTAGLTELVYDSSLQQAADLRAVEASVLWSHTRPDGSDCFTVADGVSGENLAFGYADAEAVVEGWMQSAGHRENMLLTTHTRIAVSGVKVGETMYWVQLFGK